LWHYERGNVVPPRPKMVRIAAAMLTEAEELEGGTPQSASGLISVKFPDNLKSAGMGLLALLKSLGVTATPRETLDGFRVLIRV
jgi:hypothetical protein